MKRVELIPGVTTSALGFGCAPILGAVDAKTSAKALAMALDCGVTHFDLARSYGYGQAEKFVGKYLGVRRSEVTLTTKFGIEPTQLAGLLAPVKPLVRSLRGETPPAAKSTVDLVVSNTPGRISRLLYQRPELTADFMRRSFEKSLRELGTDYVDFLLIHEPWVKICRINELLELAADFKREGKLRAFGLAFMREQKALHIGYLPLLDVRQFDNSPGAEGYSKLVVERGTRPNFFFSPLRYRKVGEEPAELLRMLGKDFPQSCTICSMFKPKHIRSNAGAFE